MTRRERVLPAPLGVAWALAGDPSELARWWPRVERVEGVSGGRFTEVLRAKSGRPVRADFRVVEENGPWRARWAQEVEGTPFGKVLAAASVGVELVPAGEDATKVTLTLDQTLRGMSRFGGLLVRRASRRVLDDALDGLGRALG